MAKLLALIRKRASATARLANFKKHIDNVQQIEVNLSEAEIIELEERISSVQETRSDFVSIQNEIETIVEEGKLSEQIAEGQSFEETYFLAISRAKTILANSKRNIEIVNDMHSSRESDSLRGAYRDDSPKNVKLPDLKLPSFSGNYSEWLSFYDTFNTLIHNTKLNDIKKFHYLRSCLQGDALQVIQSLEISAVNYSVAWSLLEKRFKNKKMMVHNHIKGIVEFPKISKESYSSLRNLLDTTQIHLRALKALNETVDQWDSILIYLITDKFDYNTKKEWEATIVKDDDTPTMNDLTEFLENRCHLLERIDKQTNIHVFKNFGNKHSSSKSQQKMSYANVGGASSHRPCLVCKQEHELYACKDFLELSINSRLAEIKRHKLCINCLKPGHLIANCKSIFNCRNCGKRHNTLLHMPVTQQVKHQESNLPSVENSSNSSINSQQAIASTSVANHSKLANFNQQILPTATVKILDRFNVPHECTVLLDSGSESNFMSLDLCRRLKLDTSKTNVSILGVNHSKSKVMESVIATIQSRINNFKVTLSFLLLPKITENLPSANLDIQSINLPKNIVLADTRFHEAKMIDLLVGVDAFWDILCDQGELKHPYLHKTVFGFIVSGSLPQKIDVNRSSLCYFNSQDISQQISKFWEVENYESTSTQLSTEEKLCESHFVKTAKRDRDGRFIVSIPLRNSLDVLGESRQQAERRFLSLEKRLQRNENLRKMYLDFMKEYEQLGHMSEVDGSSCDPPYSFYLPHHGVLKQTSLTTKCRIVFDGSCPSSSGVSINDLQMVGPTVQRDLFSILISFRKHKYVISADCTKMYRSVYVEPSQWPLQRIIWRSNSHSPLKAYNLRTVTYGLASSSFLAIRCLFQLARGCEDTHPKISHIIKNDMYVDDLLTGADTLEEASYICKNIAEILKSGCFELRKWISNDVSILHSVRSSETSYNILEFGLDEITKTLGLSWSSHSDKLLYKINVDEQSNRSITKRSILSIISQVFDPLGLISACTIIAKIMMQKLWIEGLSWDEPVSEKLKLDWIEYCKSLPQLNNIRINRQVCCAYPKLLEIHSFCDASQSAYGTCVYVRSINSENKIFVHLLCAKTKVAPLKSLTIPKLELLGAYMLVKLVQKVIRALDVTISRIVHWCDSTIVLGWIHTSPHLLKTFVSNRISEIQLLSNPSDWRHVPTKENPADLLSRGLKPIELQTSSLWWGGPSFLSQPESQWPNAHNVSQNLPELKEVMYTHVITKDISFPFEKYSSLTKLERIIAYCLRFKHNSQISKCERIFGSLTLIEINKAHICLVKIVQLQTFADEINLIANNKSLRKKDKIMSLNPFIHIDGTLRAGGRISNSNFSFGKKHPIIVPSKHHFTKLLFAREHLKLLHAGPQLLLSSIRQNYWPISGRNLAKRTVHDCIRCFRAKPTQINPIMGNLPKDRLTPAPPFQITGTDYAGPFNLKDRKGRGAKISKCYVCLFVCFTTKAIHIELVSDLSTEAFVLALRRFAGRRGMPLKIYSDNGLNFVGASTQIRELGNFLVKHSKELQDAFVQENFNWHFIPVNSPHMGGLWEAGVKAVKHHLRRVLENALLTFEQFYSILVQIESVLNSRPLFPHSSNPSDLTPLTPSHFLVGRPLTEVPDPNLTEIPESRLSHYQRLQQLIQHFWHRWSAEYISELQQRCKWKTNHPNLKVGTLVIIKDDNLPPTKWRLGRITELHPGTDSIVRVVSIRTAKGTTRRAITRICPLPVDQASSDTEPNVH